MVQVFDFSRIYVNGKKYKILDDMDHFSIRTITFTFYR